MPAIFIPSEEKIRPDVYYRYVNAGTSPIPGADDGKCACVFKSDWGPLSSVSILENYDDVTKIYGSNNENNTLDVAAQQFRGGAKTVFAIRLGTGGAFGTCSIKDSENKDVVLLTLKYPGSKKFFITIRKTLIDPDVSEIIIQDGSKELEKLAFANKDNLDNVAALLTAFSEKGSSYFNLTKITDSDKTISLVASAEITGGENPIVSNDSYSTAFDFLDAYRWNVLSIDTEDKAVSALMVNFIDKIYQTGNFCMGVVGETSNIPFETRLETAKSFNNSKIVYVGNGFTDSLGNVYEGYLAAARIAGIIASTPSNESVTHLAISGAAALTEPLTNSQYERAIISGMLTFSLSSAGIVWIEQGINTLVNLSTNDDAGWKKIKRVKVRFELFRRLNAAVEFINGRVNNDDDGRMTIIQAANNVCNAMVAEGKLLSGAYVEVDPDNKPRGDSAWFVVHADDIDALEKMYFTFKFRFTTEE